MLSYFSSRDPLAYLQDGGGETKSPVTCVAYESVKDMQFISSLPSKYFSSYEKLVLLKCARMGRPFSSPCIAISLHLQNYLHSTLTLSDNICRSSPVSRMNNRHCAPEDDMSEPSRGPALVHMDPSTSSASLATSSTRRRGHRPQSSMNSSLDKFSLNSNSLAEDSARTRSEYDLDYLEYDGCMDDGDDEGAIIHFPIMPCSL